MQARHRDEYLPPKPASLFKQINERVADYISEHILASLIMFDMAIILPLVCLLPGMHALLTVTMILSSNWVQLWALPALQRANVKLGVNQDAKADVDHHNISQVLEILQRIESTQEKR